MKLFSIFALLALALTSPIQINADIAPTEQQVHKQNRLNHFVLTSNNYVSIKGPIKPETTGHILLDLHSFYDGSKGNDVVVFISTGGGSVSAGNQIIEAIRTLADSGKNVVCVADVAMSMGFVILQSCPTRYYISSSLLMQHQMSLGTKGSIEHIKTYMTYIDTLKEELEHMQADRIGMSVDEFRERTISDWWLYGKDIERYNVADKQVHVTCGHDLLTNTKTDELFTIFGKVRLTHSSCPLLREPLKVDFDDGVPKNVVQDILREYSV
jgi:ATP-dependent protease ClpP protease subunit